MADNQKQLDELNKKIHLIELRQEQINADLVQIKKEISTISSTSDLTEQIVTPVLPTLPTLPTLPVKEKPAEVIKGPVIEQAFPVIPKVVKEPKKKKEKTPLEEFIGTNLLNKIGIAVLVIGIGIGAKYAIDHELISPLTRIVLGYLCGIVLIALGMRMKAKYENFSAVLLSGGMAVLYFITFAAYDLYQLIPQMLAFALMVVFTAFTVFAAIQYNLQVIAIIALVGAYGVPFLLSNGSGQVGVLFTYMSIINGGILILSFKKTWKALYYSAFILTWLIYSAWVMDRYQADDHLWISLIFSSIFFITFYITLLSYKLLQNEPLSRWDIILLTANSFIYYGFGYFVIDEHQSGDVFLGVFTLFNAILHFLACYAIYKKQDATRDTFYFVAGLVLVFLTLAVPVQLDSNWVTLIWAAEAVLLFWIGRTKSFPVYERLSYVLILLAVGSLVQDWDDFYGHYYKGMKELYVPFFLNIQFLSSLLVCVALGAIFKISRDHQIPSPGNKINSIFNWVIPSLLVITLYFSFYNEIDNFWSQKFIDSEMTGTRDDYEYNFFDNDLPRLETIWVMIYSSVFITLFAFLNHRFVKNKIASYVITGFAALLLLNFVSLGLTELGYLRDSFLTQEDAKYYFRTSGNIIIRYVAILFMLPLLVIVYKNMQAEEIKDVIKKIERAFFHFIILALLSSELINILDMSGINDSDKLALSILWGAYALILIIYGLVKNIKFIRITAISLFGITLLKLFFYDLSSMSTIAKTIVMMVLGVLLLVASFLYNKFKRANDQKQKMGIMNQMKSIKSNMKKNLTIGFIFIQICLGWSQTSFHYKRKLAPVEKEGWYSVVLPVDLFQHITNSYSDIRILQINEKDSAEVPYLLRIKNDEVNEGFIDLEVLNQSKKDGKLYLTFKLNKGQEVNYLDLKFEEENYNGYVKLEGSNDQKEWFELVNHQRILAIKNNTVDFQFSTLSFPLTNYKFLRAAISNDKPLTFTGAFFRTKKIKSGSFNIITPRLTTTQHKKEKQTIVEMSLVAYQPVSKVSIKINSQGDYYRSFSLETLRDSAQAPNQTWTYYYEPLANGYLTSVEPNDFQFEVINTRKLKLTIYNEDNVPLHMESIHASGPHIELVSQLKPGNNYLFYGNEVLALPEYDLVHFTDQVPAELNNLAVETEETLIADKEKGSPLMENKLWLWGAMILIIGLLGFATLKMMARK